MGVGFGTIEKPKGQSLELDQIMNMKLMRRHKLSGSSPPLGSDRYRGAQGGGLMTACRLAWSQRSESMKARG